MKHAAVRALIATFALTTTAIAFAATAPDPLTKPIPSPYADKWLRPQEPVRIYGNTYYVGFGGLSLVLIKTDAGLILIDGALPQSVSSTEANIRKLGFRVEDIKFILNTEAHFDHSGGIAALARDSGATVVTSPRGAQALRDGHVASDDPQAGEIEAFAPVAKVRGIGDGETLRLGNTAVIAHFTPGHTPGSTSWSWTSCEGDKCLDVVFAASLNPVAADGFRFSGDATHGDITEAYRKGIRGFANLPCDILISAHPDHSGFDGKFALLQAKTTPNPFIDPNACRTYADKYEKILDARVVKEKPAAKPAL
ncbi:metallo-beta-lactamase class B [Dyella sp. OK004]|uniref:subclass B3 metallo-beta-lactamase n=1 Tax=Dyella sp. OK004 TaxID=1855292 RepID=UPI0008F07E57|nr:subclass B3 metallo-beta-lactamase [Dyella sp. OK004]SFS18822.1 metallo-beta-lactamase class B [Dyella sp. OK004]